jgi:hypothetical protein
MTMARPTEPRTDGTFPTRPILSTAFILVTAATAQAAADKAWADVQPAIDSTRAKITALKAELDLLAAEKKVGDATRPAMTTPPLTGS